MFAQLRVGIRQKPAVRRHDLRRVAQLGFEKQVDVAAALAVVEARAKQPHLHAGTKTGARAVQQNPALFRA